MPKTLENDHQIQEMVSQTMLFRELPPAQVQRVLRQASQHSRPDSAFFFMEGDPAVKSFAVISGKVRLSQVTPDGQQVILGYIGAGREFGIVATLGEITYPVSAQAVGETSVLVWDSQALNQLMLEIPQITRNALYIMARQIREFQARIRELSTQRVERRIARTLLRLAQQSGRRTDEGVLIDLPLTRQDLAEMSGTTLYTVSRTLSQWEALGWVVSGRERVVITRPHDLVNLAEDLPVSKGSGAEEA
jgi:CRP/FNR family transcriptional regulator, nitrogen oxide reductase regulator